MDAREPALVERVFGNQLPIEAFGLTDKVPNMVQTINIRAFEREIPKGSLVYEIEQLLLTLVVKLFKWKFGN